jgi:hypothetical protein
MLSRRFNVAIVLPASADTDVVLTEDVTSALTSLVQGPIGHFVRVSESLGAWTCATDAAAERAYRAGGIITNACTLTLTLILDATAAQHPAFRARAARIQELMDLAQVRADIENVIL